MNPRNAAAAYHRTSVDTAEPGRLIIMLYDGALRFLGEAREALEHGDFAAKGRAIDRVLAIVEELRTSLVPRHAPALCEDLAALYDFVSREVLLASAGGAVERLDAAAAVLRTLREGWQEALARLHKEAP